MAEVCREFGISRKTGYKIFDRYKEHGLEALSDRSRRPVRYANQLPAADREPDRHPQARQAALGRAQDPRAPRPPPRRRRPRAGQEHHPRRAPPPRPGQGAGPAPPSRHRHAAVAGRCAERSVVRRLQGRVQARQRPILLPADRHRPRLALPAPLRSPPVHPRGPRLHRLRAALPASAACPQAIRSDNGVPFASPNGLFNLSKLAVWWLRLGIAIERIKPGHPQQNGRHERMHLTLKKEATRPPGHQQPAAAGPLRRLPHGVQHRAAPRGPRHELPRRGLLSPRHAPMPACRNSPIRCTTATSSSPPAAASACTARRSTSRPSSPDSASASRRSTTAFGSSASCATISASSIWSRKPCNPSTTPSGQGCHPCLRDVLLPMCPGRTL